jgi:crossover junction endodeoxyribonuclease RusA
VIIPITLGWPSADLSPNARVHWARLARAKKVARSEAFFQVLEMRRFRGYLPKVELSVTAQVTFYPPNLVRRDVDNFIARIKPHLDGIADAIGVDDSKWTWAAPVMAAPEKPARVVVTLTVEAAS